MCRPHGTAFLPPDVCRRKERKEQKKERKQERKKEKQKTATLKPGIRPSHHHYRIIEPNHPLLLVFFFSSSHLHSSKNPTIPMLNSNLAYQKTRVSKKNPQVHPSYTNKSVWNLHFTGQRSCPHSKFAHTFCSTIVSAPQRQHVQRGQGSYIIIPTNKHISFIQLKMF